MRGERLSRLLERRDPLLEPRDGDGMFEMSPSCRQSRREISLIFPSGPISARIWFDSSTFVRNVDTNIEYTVSEDLIISLRSGVEKKSEGMKMSKYLGISISETKKCICCSDSRFF